ncbi:DUF320-domain-containing protein [Conidiobolus coronatus NRRL 28638]|uniref:DUF320-domain-containing protein n=1 Tax=Conidiobolus coronatus (strain ATCC 28846 / CBS 209.66 / NRRL 28638) TaxID=796925 RepID=A0A137NX94_CONC2|nr:DUF320-domain-containing protein [Conidiobolus coronatus NRRL 28638]|eukprot:KXN67274.1 DUF320-domain-containing protein [Conidiobolus coronatus NRRL 28638]
MQLVIFAALAQLALGAPLDAEGASVSPGAVSGNVVQVPAHIPVNAVGNSVNVIGVLNPAFGNSASSIYLFIILINMQLIIFAALAQLALGTPIDATGASESAGTGTGNVIQLPLDIPVNAVGNSINVIGVGNPTFGNSGTNTVENL